MVTVNWSDPKLRNCIALITTFDGRPERHYPSGRVERLSVDNSSNSISKTPAHIGSGRYSSEFVGNTSDDRIDLGSITSADPISFFGKTTFSLVFRGTYELANSQYPRHFDKSTSTGVTPGGWGSYIGTGDYAWRLAINGTNVVIGNVNPATTTVHTFGLSTRGVGSSGTSTQGYINGTLFSDVTWNAPVFPSTTASGSVGGIVDRQWKGNIEYVALFDKPLSDAEHLAFDRNGYSFFGSRQIVYSTGSSVESAATNKLVMII